MWYWAELFHSESRMERNLLVVPVVPEFVDHACNDG